MSAQPQYTPDQIKQAARNAYNKGDYAGAKRLDGLYQRSLQQQPQAQAQPQGQPQSQAQPQAKDGAFEGFGDAFIRGIDQPLENMGVTAEALGYQNVADSLKGAVDERPGQSASAQFMNADQDGSFAWRYLPKAGVEQAGQFAGSILSRLGGMGLGGLAGSIIPGAGTAGGAMVGGLTGPMVFEAAQQLGPIALERAKNNGRKVPNAEDWKYATGTSAGMGALNAIAPGLSGKLKRMLVEGATEGTQSVVEQVGSTVNTKKGLEVDPRQALAEGIIGGTSAGMVDTSVGTVRAAANLVTGGSSKSDMTEEESQAAASYAQRLIKKAEANGYDLRDIDTSSDKGARQAVDSTHVDMTEELRQLFNDLKPILDIKDTDSLDAVAEKVLAKVAYRKARNKTKNTVEQEDFAAVEKLAGNTQEGQRALNIMRELNQMTSIHNGGYKGGVSQYTDQLAPLGLGGEGYDRGKAISERLLRPLVSAQAFASTGGSSLLGQLGIMGTGRAIDKVTGRRSTVQRYVDQYGNQQGQPAATGPSVRESNIEEIQEEERLAAEEAARQEQLSEERRDANLQRVQQGAPPQLGSPEDIVRDGTGLDRAEIAKVLRILKANPNTLPGVRRAIEAYEQGIAVGGEMDFSLIRDINAFVDANPDYVQRSRQPNIQRAAASAQAGAQQNLSQRDQNYQRGIENNLAFVKQLQDQLNDDKSVRPIEKAKLLDTLNSMQFDLGADPIAALKAHAERLYDGGVSEDAMQKYFVPYMERVQQQQQAAQRKKLADRSDTETIASAQDAMDDARIVPVPFNNQGMQNAFGVTSPTEGGNYIDLDSKEDLTGNTYAAGSVKIIDGKPMLETNDAPAAPATRDSGNKVKVNLFKKKAGWSWVDYDGPDTIVSTEQGGKHHYSLNTDFQTPVTLQTYPKQPSEPRLRPTSQGKVVLGNKVGSISVRGKVHPVYDQVTIEDKRADSQQFNDDRSPQLTVQSKSKYTTPRRQKSGKYIGSPRGLNTPDKLYRLRRYVKELATKGSYGRFWYERSGETILAITGGNVDEAKKLVRAIAITSPSTPVDTNFEYAIQAYYQWKNGQPIETGRFPESMGRKITDVFEGRDWSGRKTNNFENNLLRSIDGSLEQGVTTDLWMMRAFGYTSDAATDLNYDFVENETYKIAEELGWEPQQVQAAIWVEIKSRMESKPLKKEVDRLSEKQGNFKWVEDRKGKKIREFKDLAAEQAHGQLWVKKALAYEPTALEREAAKFDYRDATLNKMAQISVESIPSTKAGHLSEIFDAPVEQIIEYHHAMDKAFLDDDGYDIVAKELGMLQMGVSHGLGSWEGRNDPVSQNEIVVPRQYRVKEDGVISEDAKDLIAAYAAVKGILLKQDGIGWHRPFFKKSQKRADQNGIDVNIGRPFSLAETQAISAALSQYGLEPISTATGVRFINFSDDNNSPYSGLQNYEKKKADLDFEKVINQALEGIQFENDEAVTATRFVSDNDLIENNWQENTNGEGYLENRLSGRPDLQRRVTDIIAQLQPRVREVESEFSERYGWTPNAALNTAYDVQQSQVGNPPERPSPVPSDQGPILTQDERDIDYTDVTKFLPPTVNKVKDQLPEAQAIVDGVIHIGKKGTKFENGIGTEEDLLTLADHLDIAVKIYDDAEKYYEESGDSGRVSSGRHRGDAYSSEVWVKGKELRGELPAFITLTHEISHGIENRPEDPLADDNLYENSHSHPGATKNTAARYYRGSLRHKISEAVYAGSWYQRIKHGKKIYSNAPIKSQVANDITYGDAAKIKNEIEKLQRMQVGIPSRPDLGTDKLRGTPDSIAKKMLENEIKAMGQPPREIDAREIRIARKVYKKDIEKVMRPYRQYIREDAEFAVDPVILYLMDPKTMKRVAPVTSKYIRDHFNKSTLPVKFHANPMAVILSILMAGALMKGEEEEEEKMAPGVLSPQPALLSA